MYFLFFIHNVVMSSEVGDSDRCFIRKQVKMLKGNIVKRQGTF